MTTEEDFEKWWAEKYGNLRSKATRRIVEAAYRAATQRTAQRCVEICRTAATEDAHAFDCASRIREQFLP